LSIGMGADAGAPQPWRRMANPVERIGIGALEPSV